MVSRRHHQQPPGRRAVLHPAAVSPVPLGSRCRTGARRVSAGQRLRTGTAGHGRAPRQPEAWGSDGGFVGFVGSEGLDVPSWYRSIGISGTFLGLVWVKILDRLKKVV